MGAPPIFLPRRFCCSPSSSSCNWTRGSQQSGVWWQQHHARAAGKGGALLDKGHVSVNVCVRMRLCVCNIRRVGGSNMNLGRRQRGANAGSMSGWEQPPGDAQCNTALAINQRQTKPSAAPALSEKRFRTSATGSALLDLRPMLLQHVCS